MYYKMVEKGKEPTPFQISRLRSYEVTSRLNNVIFEVLDLATDIAFILVLFDQSGDIILPEAWEFYEAKSSCPGLPPGGPSPEFFRNLGIAGAAFVIISTIGRLALSLRTVVRKYSEVSGFNEWAWVILGTLVSIVDPWNGSLMINQVMEKRRIERDDYHLARAELKADILLVTLENVPQLTIQIIYGAETGQANFRAVAWYVATFFTVFHTITQVLDIIDLSRQLPELYLAKQEGNGHIADGQIAPGDLPADD